MTRRRRRRRRGRRPKRREQANYGCSERNTPKKETLCTVIGFAIGCSAEVPNSRARAFFHIHLKEGGRINFSGQFPPICALSHPNQYAAIVIACLAESINVRGAQQSKAKRAKARAKESISSLNPAGQKLLTGNNNEAVRLRYVCVCVTVR